MPQHAIWVCLLSKKQFHNLHFKKPNLKKNLCKNPSSRERYYYVVYKCLHELAPPCLVELVTTKTMSQYSLHSNVKHLLLVPRTKCKTLGDHSLHVSGPSLWNKLPEGIKAISSLDQIKHELKTYLFKRLSICNSWL